jgi:transposase InsO family protein
VHAEVRQAKARSGWSAGRTLQALGIARSSYYRWLREESWARGAPAEPVRPVQAFEALAEEKAAVRKYALQHPEVRHRELSWRMIDDGVACLSASTVYRILREEQLIASWGRRKKRYREERERASRPDEIWGTDLMYLKVSGQTYFFVAFIDEYSRYVVHHALLTGMDGVTVSLAAERALETLPRTSAGTLAVKPEIRSDNGSGYISKEFHGLLEYHGLTHHKITPHCPEENGIMERANRTFREALEEVPLSNRFEAEDALRRIITHYNTERLHSSLGYLRPADYYRGNPVRLHARRRRKLSQARHRRKQINLGIRQRTLPFENPETVPSRRP